MDQILLVICNVPDAASAQQLAEEILKNNYAACVNVMPEMRSFYNWNGRQETSTEFALLIKSTQTRYAELQALIENLHPYEVPEIIAIPVAAGLPAYLQWVLKETGSK
ncbi:divalent-cation tolerance protein CutA [Undibacterium terreum]|uniref:Divalent-cation tolerance protein CutA n=1 Tax=Undibacterium terreum TaxID=1224302 RepID=A0A916UPB0_9BURK|nr:divalent-cation tolerance protein CutA [Undibacterium terreum]GGC80581.1 divalent-cation tolerance protein CutA [Undibacterium terreum]